MFGTSCSCVRSDKRRAHNLLKPHCIVGSSQVKDTIDVRVFYSRYKTRSLLRPDLTIELYQIKSLLLWLRVKLLIYM